MKKFKTKLFGILTAVTLLAGAIPAHAESTTIHVEGETGYRQSGGGVEIIEDGTLVRSMPTSADDDMLASGQVYLEYEVYTGSAGMYTINWKSSVMEGNQNVSKATLSVNGNSVTPTQLDGPSGTWNLGNHTANVYFDAGINTVRFTVNAKRGKGDIPLFCLDYFEAIPENAKRYEAETYMTSYGSGWVSHETMKFNVSAIEQDLKDGKVYCEQTVDVPKSGIYKLTWKGTLLGGSQYVSPVTLTVNGTSVTSEKDTSYDGTQYYQTADVVLSEGENTVRYTINGFRGNGGQAVFQLDYIELEYVDSAVRYGSLKYEGEDPAGSGDANIKGDSYSLFSNGAIRRIWKDGSTTTTVSIPKGGAFDMYLTLGADVNATKLPGGAYLGTCSISIDGGEEILLSDVNCEYVSGFSGSGFYTNSAKWKYTPGVNFEEGSRKITVKCSGLGSLQNENGNFILYDCIEFVPKDSKIDTAVIKVNSNKMAAGSTLQADAALYYDNGYKCSDSQITSVSYVSSNTIVATVDENGVITGKNPGSATITVTYNDTYSASVNITVYDESGIIPISSNYDGTNAVIKLTRVANTTGTADVIIGAYSQKDGVNTSLKGVDPVTDVNPAYGNVVTVQREIAGDKISAFIWDSIEGMKPITDVITLK